MWVIAGIGMLVAHYGVKNHPHARRFDNDDRYVPDKAPLWVPLKYDDKCDDMNQQKAEKSDPEFDLPEVCFI